MKDELIPTEFNGERVLTTGQLAKIYETTPRRVTENFKRNEERFIRGKHYYYLEAKDLKIFLQYATSVVQNPSKIRHLYLWTERGADRHCKILDTDKAWEQFDHLEDTYFKVKDNKKLLNNIDTQTQILQLAQGTQLIANVVQGLQSTINNIQEYVKDSINSKDSQINHIAELVGLRSRNTMYLSKQLKIKLSELSGQNITAKNELYIKFKHKIFKQYKVFKWEDIPVEQINRISADICEIDTSEVGRLM